MFIERAGSRLFCQVEGSGEPSVVFIHGVGTGHEVWSEHVHYFAAARKVVALDLRGHGQSDPADDYSQEMFVADLDAVLEFHRLRQPVLVGWSLGGSIAIRYAALYPQRVAGLVLVDHNVRAIRTKDNPLGAPPGLIEGMLRDIEEDYSGRGVRSLVDRWFSEPNEEVQPIKEWLYKLCLRTNPEVIVKIRRRGIRENRSGWLTQVRAPTLILVEATRFTSQLPKSSARGSKYSCKSWRRYLPFSSLSNTTWTLCAPEPVTASGSGIRPLAKPYQ